jgi:hypothetical protein
MGHSSKHPSLNLLRSIFQYDGDVINLYTYLMNVMPPPSTAATINVLFPAFRAANGLGPLGGWGFRWGLGCFQKSMYDLSRPARDTIDRVGGEVTVLMGFTGTSGNTLVSGVGTWRFLGMVRGFRGSSSNKLVISSREGNGVVCALVVISQRACTY